jgi:activator of 2-hydroxyglutaryl-CoA dehydratase
VIGLDGGSTSSKCVLIDEHGDDPEEGLRPVEGQPDPGHEGDAHRDARLGYAAQGATIEVTGFGVTGYAGDVLEKSLGADANIVETVAHMMSAKRWFPNVDVICDIGGQDIKVLFMQNGEIANFRLSNSARPATACCSRPWPISSACR